MNFWLPITEASWENFLNDDWTYFVGAFDDNKLIAAVGLFLNENEYEESQVLLKLQEYKIAEIGRAMVLTSYRGKGLMSEIILRLIRYSKQINIKYLIATAHPNNYPSIKSLEVIGMKYVKPCIKKAKYPGDIFLMACNY